MAGTHFPVSASHNSLYPSHSDGCAMSAKPCEMPPSSSPNSISTVKSTWVDKFNFSRTRFIAALPKFGHTSSKSTLKNSDLSKGHPSPPPFLMESELREAYATLGMTLDAHNFKTTQETFTKHLNALKKPSNTNSLLSENFELNTENEPLHPSVHKILATQSLINALETIYSSLADTKVSNQAGNVDVLIHIEGHLLGAKHANAITDAQLKTLDSNPNAFDKYSVTHCLLSNRGDLWQARINAYEYIKENMTKEARKYFFGYSASFDAINSSKDNTQPSAPTQSTEQPPALPPKPKYIEQIQAVKKILKQSTIHEEEAQYGQAIADEIVASFPDLPLETLRIIALKAARIEQINPTPILQCLTPQQSYPSGTISKKTALG